jgi:hypothetical protein
MPPGIRWRRVPCTYKPDKAAPVPSWPSSQPPEPQREWWIGATATCLLPCRVPAARQQAAPKSPDCPAPCPPPPPQAPAPPATGPSTPASATTRSSSTTAWGPTGARGRPGVWAAARCCCLLFQHAVRACLWPTSSRCARARRPPSARPRAQVGRAVERLGAAAERRAWLGPAQGAGLLRQDLAAGRRAVQDQPRRVQGQVQGALLEARHVCRTDEGLKALARSMPALPPPPSTPQYRRRLPPRALPSLPAARSSTSGSTPTSPAGRAPAPRCPTSTSASAAPTARATSCASTTPAPTRSSRCASTAPVRLGDGFVKGRAPEQGQPPPHPAPARAHPTRAPPNRAHLLLPPSHPRRPPPLRLQTTSGAGPTTLRGTAARRRSPSPTAPPPSRAAAATASTSSSTSSSWRPTTGAATAGSASTASCSPEGLRPRPCPLPLTVTAGPSRRRPPLACRSCTYLDCAAACSAFFAAVPPALTLPPIAGAPSSSLETATPPPCMSAPPAPPPRGCPMRRPFLPALRTALDLPCTCPSF